MKSTIVIGDADALVAVYFKEDIHHQEAKLIIGKLFDKNITVIFPNTAISEAITTLYRKLSNPTAADLLLKGYKKNMLRVEYLDETVMQIASELYDPYGSKKNTFFDALVAATAKKLHTDAIFSFDGWYKRLGFILAADLFPIER